MAVKSLKRAQERIEVKDLKLNALLQASLAINNNVSEQELFNIYEETLLKLHIDKLALLINDGDWKWGLSYGVKLRELDFDYEQELFLYQEITEINYLNNPNLKAFDILIPVMHQKKAIAYLIIGDVLNEAIKISPIIKHLNFIQTFTNIIAVAIENQRLATEALLQERTKKELEMASEMQSMLLPTTFPTLKGIQFSAYYKSHQKVGGDYYDVIQLDEHRCVFCIADVSGKGLSAALLMSNFQANLRVLATYSDSLESLVQKLNKKVNENAKGDRFITLFIAVYDQQNKILSYINCGHNPPILFANNEATYLNKGTVGLGMLENLPSIQTGHLTIQHNSILLAYTDGLSEVENIHQEEFGEDRIVAVLSRNYPKEEKKCIHELIKSLDQFRNQQPLTDDIALLCCDLLVK